MIFINHNKIKNITTQSMYRCKKVLWMRADVKRYTQIRKDINMCERMYKSYVRYMRYYIYIMLCNYIYRFHPFISTHTQCIYIHDFSNWIGLTSGIGQAVNQWFKQFCFIKNCFHLKFELNCGWTDDCLWFKVSTGSSLVCFNGNMKWNVQNLWKIF